MDLKAKFANSSRIDISASDSDIESYINYQISSNNRLSGFAAKDTKLRDDIISSVKEKATGM